MPGMDQSDLPLNGLRVLDFSQFLAGPACALRLGDLGAEVIKIERPQGGDLCRGLAVADQWVGADSLLFHCINRGKQSLTADLKSPSDLAQIKDLVATADVLIHNFRPGVMERIGLGYDAVRAINSRLIYGVVSGYGTSGPWRDLPGQDLLVQARSGMAWMSGSAGDGPIPMGISITDMAAGMHLTQGILAALLRQARSGHGALVEVSLLASAMDLQFEQFSSFLNGNRAVQPVRSAVNGANVHATAPYGVYATKDGHIVIAMAPIAQLDALLVLPALSPYHDPKLAYQHRDQIKAILRDHLKNQASQFWLDRLEPAGIWCAEVLDYPSLLASGALNSLSTIQMVGDIATTTCPIRLDGQVLANPKPAPALGADTSAVWAALNTPTNEAAQ